MKNQLLKEIQESGQETYMLFYADWCGHCKMIKPSLNRFVASKGINYLEIDSDSETELQKLLNVEYLPTLIHIKEGKVKKIEGSESINKLIKENGK